MAYSPLPHQLDRRKRRGHSKGRQMAEGRGQKFVTTDKPLSAAQVEELGKIRVRDVKKAIAEADRLLKPFLEARKQRVRRK